MFNFHCRFVPLLACTLIVLLIGVATPVYAASIDEVDKYAWSENVGWLNVGSVEGNVNVLPDHLEGYVWSDNIGWIRLGTHTAGGTHSYANSTNTDYGVNRDSSTGELSGYAWSENAGWVNFGATDGNASIAVDGTFSGYVWSDNVGWIKLAGTAIDSTAYAAKSGSLLNAAPTFTAFTDGVTTGTEDTEAPITLADLTAKGNAADSDGTVDGFVVSEVSTGTLKIGADATAATAWNATSNSLIDATNNAYWTPAENANGTLDAFKVTAVDNGGDESTTAVQAQIAVTAVNDAPSISDANLTGNIIYNQALTASATGFADPDTGDTAGTPAYQWHRATDANCSAGKTDIIGADSINYTLTDNDVGGYICVTVTPNDNHGLAGIAKTATSNSVVGKAPQAALAVSASPISITYNGSSSIAVSGGSGTGVISYLVTSGAEHCGLNGTTVSGTGIGNCTITASKAADGNYAVAIATVELSVGKAMQAISFAPPASKTYGDAAFAATATGGESDNAVVISSQTTEVCKVDNGSVSILKAGSCTLAANQTGNTNYGAATQVTATITIAKANQVISFGADTPASKAVGAADFAISATGGASGNSVVITSQTTDICTLENGSVSVISAGSCTLVAKQTGNDNYNAAPEKTQTIAMGVGGQVVSFDSDTPTNKTFGDAAFDVTATSTSGLAVSFRSTTPSICSITAGKKVTVLSAGACELIAEQAGNANYTAASVVTKTITVSKASQLITLTDPGVQTYVSGGLFDVVASSDAGLLVALTSTNEAVCTVIGDSVTMLSLGACTLTAAQAGNDNYTAAEAVSKTIYLTDPETALNDADTTSNGIGETLEQTFGSDDADGDGIPDTLETLLGNNVDGMTDTDGDGTPDVIEVLNGRDPAVNDNSSAGAPTITAGVSSAQLAKGALSIYSTTELGVSAQDDGSAITPVAYYALGACKEGVPYNYQTACTQVSVSGYISGTQTIWWLVADSDNNWAQAKQTLHILPRVSFSGDLVLAGTPGTGSVTTQLVLSGPAIESSDALTNMAGFVIPFTVSGVNAADHDLDDAAFTIQPGKMVSDPVTITLGNTPTHGNNLVITLDTNHVGFATSSDTIDIATQFVTAGEKTSQTVTISQGVVYPPRLSALKGTQGVAPNSVQGLVFDRAQGDMTVSFSMTDPDAGNYSYSWFGSDSLLNLSGETGSNATIDVDGLGLAAGRYYVEVQVTDSTAPNSPPAVLGGIITLVDNALSATADSDGDGVPDAEEGLGDSDGDGVSDYLDAQNLLANVVPTDHAQQQRYLVETKPGLRIIFGTTARASQTADTKIVVSDLAQHGNNGQPVSDARPINATLAHLFDYEVENMAVPVDPQAAGFTVPVVLPLDSPLAADSAFIKYDVSSSWRDFIEDSHNQIAWSNWQAGSVGSCPEAGSSAYSNDFAQKAGANCVQVTIQDGGPNDADGVVNGRIIDPLGIATTGTQVTINTVNDGGSGSGGGGSINFIEWLVGLALLLGGWRMRRRANSAIQAIPMRQEGH